MLVKVAVVACLSSVVIAIQQPAKRQTTVNNVDAQFSSVASQLISLYIPSSVVAVISSAAAANSVTGDGYSIIQSALTGTSTPAWFSAVATSYSAQIASLDSALDVLHGQASTGIPGAPRVITSTDPAGSIVVTTTPGSSPVTATASLTTTSVTSLKSAGGSSFATALSSLSSSTSASASRSASVSLSPASSSVATTSSSKAFAAPTNVPGAVVGFLGLLGVVAVL